MRETMTTSIAVPTQLVKVPARRTLPRLAHRPLRAFERIGRECNGALAQLSLGPTRPYLVTHPAHVQQVLLNIDTYRREGMLWKELQRLEGDGLAGEGPTWQRSRRMLQPLMSARGVNTLLGGLAAAVDEALGELAERSRDGRPVSLLPAMTRITHRVLIRVFFSDQISDPDADRLGHAINTALRIIRWRMLLPSVGDAVPLPGDRAFRRAVGTIDTIMYPLIRAYRSGEITRDQPAEGNGTDFVAMVAHAVDDNGEPLEEKRVRDDVVAMFVAGTETIATTLTWLFLLLDRHPEIAAGVAAEAADVIGNSPLRPEQLPALVRTRMALEETLRLYPPGWLIPRRVARPDAIGGTDLSPGDTVVLSPFLTHRLAAFWPDPYEFRPERFAPGQERRHRFAYLPFGVGAHQCLGDHFALREAQLAVAGLFSRFRPRLHESTSMEPRVAPMLQPRRRPQLVLEQRRRRG
jgi:cytochrome P450